MMMAQRNSASANTTPTAAPQAEGARRAASDPVPSAERARAAAYLDLWERHLSHAAAHWEPGRPARRGAGARGR
jgi:hypothetical protein